MTPDEEFREYDRLIGFIDNSLTPAQVTANARRVKTFIERGANPVYAETLVRLLNEVGWRALRDVGDHEPVFLAVSAKALSKTILSTHAALRATMDNNDLMG